MAPSPSASPIVVVGAGLAGLTAAAALADRGRSVIVLEADQEVGGRLATRRVGRALADVGAQFFTTRSPAFTAFVADLVTAGLAYEWCRGFNEVDGYPRYAVRGGMAALAEHVARGLDVRCGVAVAAVGPRGGEGWEVRLADGEVLVADAVVLTPPVPVSLGLLAAGRGEAGGGSVPPTGVMGRGSVPPTGVADVRYHSVLAVVAELDRPPAIPQPGGRQLSDGPFSFVADNATKGLSPVPSVTLHAAHDLSAARWDDDPSVVLDDLLAAAGPWLGSAGVVCAELHAWAWSGPVEPWPDRMASLGDRLVLAGDAFGGPKVEGAWLSGRAAADALVPSPAPAGGGS